jgi:hypothetical protein
LRPVFSSLAAFLAAGARPPTPLARAIVLVLVLKMIGMAGIKLIMFPENAAPAVDAAAMARLLGAPSSDR